MSHSVLRIAVLALSLGVLSPAWCQQSQPTSPANTTTTFVPNTPVYQGNATHGQETGTAQQIEPPVSAGQVMPSAPSSSPQSPAMARDAGPGTAVEQGYDPYALDARAAAQRAADEAANDNPRQRGEHLGIPSYRNTVARNPADAEWLINWKQKLVDVGVHPDKVDFEAGRLPHDDFALWASRMVWALDDPRPRQRPVSLPKQAPAAGPSCCSPSTQAACCR